MTDAVHEQQGFRYDLHIYFGTFANLGPAQIETLLARIQAGIGEVVAVASDVYIELNEHEPSQIDPKLLLPITEWLTPATVGAEDIEVSKTRTRLRQLGLIDVRAVLAMGVEGLMCAPYIKGKTIDRINTALAVVDSTFRLETNKLPVQRIASMYHSLDEVPVFVATHMAISGRRSVQDFLATTVEELAIILAPHRQIAGRYANEAKKLLDMASAFKREFEKAKGLSSGKH